MQPATKEAYKLMHNGSLALSDVERAGIRVDVNKLQRTIDKVRKRIKSLQERLRDSEVHKVWRKQYGQRMNINSRPQLSNVLFNTMGEPRPDGVTATGRTKMSMDVLEKLDLPFVKDYLEIQKLEKLLGTYLKGVQKHVVDGFIHPNYALHTTITFRGSCLEPNFQNIPIRDPQIGKLIRSCFIAREGHQLLETDFKGAEVCTASCYHKDPTMLKYLETGYDMHKAMAAECYILPKDEIPKPIRQQVKSYFVFAEFYGDWYPNVANNLWEAIDRHKLTTKDGLGLYKHLEKQGIMSVGACDPKKESKPGTLEHHIKKVERRFWNERFPVYSKWKDDYFAQYLRDGYFRTLTGFLCQGIYGRNQVVNSPIQGSAFHCLLWSLIRINKLLRKRKMKSVIVGQIHDSILSDIQQNELDDYLALVVQVVEQDLPKAWPWIITKMTVEAELSPVGGSWYDKTEIQLVA